jgi:hypothetical protein
LNNITVAFLGYFPLIEDRLWGHTRFLAKGGGSHSTDMSFPLDWPAFKKVLLEHTGKTKLIETTRLKPLFTIY